MKSNDGSSKSAQDRLEDLERRRQKIEAMRREREAKKSGEISSQTISSPLTIRPSTINTNLKKSPKRSSMHLSPKKEELSPTNSGNRSISNLCENSVTYENFLKNVLKYTKRKVKRNEIKN